MFAKRITLFFLLLFSLETQAAPSNCGPIFSKLQVLADGARLAPTKVLRDGNFYVAYTQSTHQIRVIDLAKGKTEIYSIDFEFVDWALQKDGLLFHYKQEAYPAPENQYFKYLDFSSGQIDEYEAAANASLPGSRITSLMTEYELAENLATLRPAPKVFNPEGTHFSVTEGNGIRIYELGTEESRRIELPAEVTGSVTIPNTWKHIVSFNNHPPVIVDLASGEIRPLFPLSENTNYPSLVMISRDGKHATFARQQSLQGDSQLVYIDLSTFQPREYAVRMPKNYSISPDGAWAIDIKDLENPSTQFKLVSTKGSESRIITETGRIDQSSYQFSENGKFLHYSTDVSGTVEGMSTPKKMVVIDLATGNKKEITYDASKLSGAKFLSLTDDGKQVLLHNPVEYYGSDKKLYLHRWNVENNKFESMVLPEVSGSSTYLVEKDGQSILVFNAAGSTTPKPVVRIKLQSWGDVAKLDLPPLPADEASLIRELAPILRTDKYKTGAHYPLVTEYFEKGYFRNKPEYILPVLFSVLEDSPTMYRQLLQKYPDIYTLAKPPIPGWDDLPAKVKKSWSKAAEDHINTRIQLHGTTSATLEEWKDLRPLQPLFEGISEDSRSEFARLISGTLTAHAGNNSSLSGVYDQKVFKFAKAGLKRFFGLEDKHFTDLAVTRTNSSITPILLGTDPIEGGMLSEYGIYIKHMDEIAIPARPTGTNTQQDIADLPVSWRHGDQNFTATIKVGRSERRLGEIAPSTAAPDYASMWKDKKLTGLVMPDQREGADLLDNYLEYYLDQGFQFERDMPISNIKGFAQNEITSGRLDYFIKEAHSDGSDQYLFRFYSSGVLKKGIRQLEEGKEEVVYLFYPDSTISSPQLIEVNEFGQWIRQREVSTAVPQEAPQLGYFNTSCFSTTKACAELGAAASDRLLNISTPSMAVTLTNSEDSTLKRLIDSFRSGKTYEEMRQSMSTAPDYMSGSDRYIFPDSPEFDTAIRQKLGDPVNVKIEIKDPEGKIYDFDQHS
jgi:hypothetical protein